VVVSGENKKEVGGRNGMEATERKKEC